MVKLRKDDSDMPMVILAWAVAVGAMGLAFAVALLSYAIITTEIIP